MGIGEAILTMLGEVPQASGEYDSSGDCSLLTQLAHSTRVGAVATLRVVTRALTPPIPWDVLLEKRSMRWRALLGDP